MPDPEPSPGIDISGTVTTGRDLIGRDLVQNITLVLQMPAFAPPPDLVQLRADYLAHLKRQYRALDFKGIPQLETFSRELLLEEVYVPLVARPEMPAGETWERRLAGRAFHSDELPDDARLVLEKGLAPAAPVRVEEAMRDQPRVVVIGDPGSGKSTLLKHLTLRLASEGEAPLPILVPLNAYADALSRADRNLQSYLADYFAGLSHGVAGFAPFFDRALAQGQAVILLDGLDEVQANRAHLVTKVQAFAEDATARGNKIVVTSRIVGYRESPLDPKTWSLYTLLDFDDAAMEQFAAKWCTAFEVGTRGDTPEARADAERERISLMESIRGNPGVTNLASNPLLLTILALIKRQGVSLPDRRIELYDLYLRTLISAWSKARALDKRPVGVSLDYAQTVAVLQPLALWLRTENPTAGLVSERQMLDWLTRYFMGDEWGLKRGPALERAGEFLQSVHKYSNLLVERGKGQYGFMHLTFEEALAAMGLVEKGQLDRGVSIALIQEHLTDPAWRETILLAIGVWGLLYNQRLVAGEVVRAILQMPCVGEVAGQNILLAGACLEDVGEAGLGRAAVNDVTNALIQAMRNRGLPPAAQRDAGFILGRIGWTPPDLEAFIQIPAGEFLYGDDKKRVRIAIPFSISKYPVTNLQYRRFVDADGYNHREFWSDDGWAWRTGNWDTRAKEEYVKNRLAGRPAEKRDEPFFWHDAKWNNPLAPVVGVSWFEAEAYCNWLSQEGRSVRLPTEQEWERAARHTDGRAYPWGDKFDRNRLNCAEFWAQREFDEKGDKWMDWVMGKGSDVFSTSVVGQFPKGNSQAGVDDMSGNVWEWTGSDYDNNTKVLRGGSWSDIRGYARCACRIRLYPDLRSGYFGFRVAQSVLP